MANIEKHMKSVVEQIEQADFSDVPSCGRSSHLTARYVKRRLPGEPPKRCCPVEARRPVVVVRLDDTPATVSNVERIRDRVRSLNQRLADSEAPFRLRIL